jgi:sulfonate transport system ATP-binding protein
MTDNAPEKDFALLNANIFAFRPVDGAMPASHQPPAPLVQLRGFTRKFGKHVVLDGIDLDIAEGEFVALLGRSGSGKTTLLRTLAGLDASDEGNVKLPNARAVVFQEPRLLPWKRVWENVLLGYDMRALGGAQKGRLLAQKALAEVGLDHRVNVWPATLSGGEAQRAALARALVREPKLLLLDEPFASLDALTRMKMQGLVAALCRAHSPAVLLVTHDVDEALTLADRVLVLAEGRLIVERQIDLPPGRHAGHPDFIALRQYFLSALGVEMENPVVVPQAPAGGAGIMVGG